jgi:cobalt-zinc-cadmium efflux system protein
MDSHDPHDHSHSHAPAEFGRAFAIGMVLNITFVVVEVVFGLLGNSTALLADAGHNVSDILGLLVSWVAATLAKRPPTATYTYGLRSSSILAALFNAMFLLVAVGAIGWEAIQRLSHPEPVASTTIMVVAGIGILINGATAMLFMSGRKSDINIEGAFLDAAVSLCDLRRHPVEHVGPVAKVHPHVAGCGPGSHRSRRGTKIPRRATGRIENP